MNRRVPPARAVTARVVVGALAVVAMVTIIASGPVLLLTLGGNPVPERLPSIDELATYLRTPDDGTLLLWMLTMTGWAAWAVLAGSLLLELGAQLAGRRAPGILGGPQRVAHLLVAAALASLSAPGVSHADAAYVETTVHEVAEGDWMWHIAGRYLGDEQRYGDIAGLNPHLAERYEEFPDHIRPGDRLVLPADALDRGVRAHATGAPVTSAPVSDPTGPAVPAPAPREAPEGPAPPEPLVPEPPADAPEAPAPEPDPAGNEGSAMLAGGMVASALLGALLLYRARKSAHRRYRRVVVSGEDAAAEQGVRVAAGADVSRVDHVLRVLAGGGSMPDVAALRIADGDIHLVLAAPREDAPPPFRVTGAGRWALPADAALPEPPGIVAPLPALVTIGSAPDGHLLVDLERLGALTIGGDGGAAGDLLRHIAAELAHNPWSDRVEVALVGFPAAEAELLVSLNPSRLRIAPSLAEELARLRGRVGENSGALRAHDLPDAADGRVRDTAADSWTPRLLLVRGADADNVADLDALATELAAAGRRCAVAVVSTATATADLAADTGGRGYGGGRVTVTDDGRIDTGTVAGGHGTLTAAALPAHLLEPYAALVRDAADPADHPLPPAPEPWAAGTDATGGPLPPAPTDRASTGIDAPTVPLPTIGGTGGRRLEELEEQVQRWWNGDVPTLAILGPVRVTAPGPAPTHRPRACEELVALLAAYGARGLTAAEIGRYLWPGAAPSAAVRTAVITDTRRWLGDAPDGQPWLAESDAGGRYRLRDGVLVDWHLFRRLRARGLRHRDTDDLRTALRLVRGAPPQGAADPGAVGARVCYSWLPGSPFAPDVVRAGVIDTAHELVEQCLAAGDPVSAGWAVQQAWLADPHRHDDLPWRDLMRVTAHTGDPESLRALVADLLHRRELDSPDELSDDTRELIESLLPATDRR